MNVWKVAVVSLAIVGCRADGGAANATGQREPPAGSPRLFPDFHFSDRARDARYWQLQSEVERTMAAFTQVAFAAGDAVAVPAPQPGSPAWLAARAQVERALLARRPARDALNALIFYLRHERPQLTAEEAEEAYNIIRVHEDTLLGTSDRLVDLLAKLSGIRPGQWPP